MCWRWERSPAQCVHLQPWRRSFYGDICSNKCTCGCLVRMLQPGSPLGSHCIFCQGVMPLCTALTKSPSSCHFCLHCRVLFPGLTERRPRACSSASTGEKAGCSDSQMSFIFIPLFSAHLITANFPNTPIHSNSFPICSVNTML